MAIKKSNIKSVFDRVEGAPHLRWMYCEYCAREFTLPRSVGNAVCESCGRPLERGRLAAAATTK